MIPFQEKSIVIRNDRLTEDVRRLTVQAPGIAGHARPGQFVMVRVSSALDPLLRRPFSVHQISGAGQLQILFKIVGRGTEIMAGLQPDQRLDIVGPLGRGFQYENKKKAVLIGGGMGIAPLFFLAKSMMQAIEPPEVMALLGARTKAELLPLANDMETMGISVRCSTDDGTMGHHGLVLDLVRELDPGEERNCFVCGPHPMMKAVSQFCLAMVWQCEVSLETMMACGLAACLGCAVPRADGNGYVHACKEGPVFEASEVSWE